MKMMVVKICLVLFSLNLYAKDFFLNTCLIEANNISKESRLVQWSDEPLLKNYGAVTPVDFIFINNDQTKGNCRTIKSSGIDGVFILTHFQVSASSSLEEASDLCDFKGENTNVKTEKYVLNAKKSATINFSSYETPYSPNKVKLVYFLATTEEQMSELGANGMPTALVKRCQSFNDNF